MGIFPPGGSPSLGRGFSLTWPQVFPLKGGGEGEGIKSTAVNPNRSPLLYIPITPIKNPPTHVCLWWSANRGTPRFLLETSSIRAAARFADAWDSWKPLICTGVSTSGWTAVAAVAQFSKFGPESANQ